MKKPKSNETKTVITVVISEKRSGSTELGSETRRNSKEATKSVQARNLYTMVMSAVLRQTVASKESRLIQEINPHLVREVDVLEEFRPVDTKVKEEGAGANETEKDATHHQSNLSSIKRPDEGLGLFICRSGRCRCLFHHLLQTVQVPSW